MIVFLDTNVVLDVLLMRQPFFEASRSVVRYCERKPEKCFVSALTFCTAAYVMEKAVGANAALELIKRFREIVSVSPVSEESVDWAITSGMPDFEDAMQYESAKTAGADVIVTRDPSGFVELGIRVMSPDEFLDMVQRGSRRE